MAEQAIEAQRARRSVRKLRRANPPPGMSDEQAAWFRTFNPLLCDFLIEEASEEELSAWPATFTALSELLGHAYFSWVSSGGTSFDHAWNLYDPHQHLALAPVATLLPPSFEHADHAPMYAKFIRYLVSRGAIPHAPGERIAFQYDGIAFSRASRDQRAFADAVGL